MTNSLLRPSPQTRCDWKSLCSRGSRLASKSGRCSSRQGRQTKPTPWTVAHSSALSIETITLSPCKTGDETANPVLDGPPRCLRREFLANRRTALIAGDPANLRSPAMFVATAVESGIPARLQFSWPRPNNSAMAAWESPTMAVPTLLRNLSAGDGLVVHIPRRFWHTRSRTSSPVRLRTRTTPVGPSADCEFLGPCDPDSRPLSAPPFSRHCPYHRDRLPGPKRADPQGCLPQEPRKNRGATEDYLRDTRDAPLSPYEIKAGRVIPAVLYRKLRKWF